MTRVHSPAFDIGLFFYLCAPKHVLDETDKYLRIYYDSLSNFLQELGSDPESVFPYDAFLKHWRKYRIFGLAVTLFALRFIMSEQNETLEFRSTEKLQHDLQYDMIHQKDQDKRVVDFIKHLVESGGL